MVSRGRTDGSRVKGFFPGLKGQRGSLQWTRPSIGEASCVARARPCVDEVARGRAGGTVLERRRGRARGRAGGGIAGGRAAAGARVGAARLHWMFRCCCMSLLQKRRI